MPQIYAYLRVSTDTQDVANQRHGVVRYCADKRLLEPIFIEDTASGKTDWRTRPLGQLVTRAGQGDVIVVSEVSRLARSTLQVLEIGRECIERGVHLHVAKNGIVFDDSMQSKIVATVLGLVAEIERDFISARTKEALAKRKAEGVKLGRPTGPARSLRLDAHASKIDDYLAKGIAKVAIAKLLDVTPNTLYAWLKARRPEANPSVTTLNRASKKHEEIEAVRRVGQMLLCQLHSEESDE
jgi:DNA invertase Pin-like site-specific DNA recombinase